MDTLAYPSAGSVRTSMPGEKDRSKLRPKSASPSGVVALNVEHARSGRSMVMGRPFMMRFTTNWMSSPSLEAPPWAINSSIP